MTKIAALFCCAVLLGCETYALAQTTSVGGTAFAELSLKAIVSIRPAERRGARSLLAQQIADLPLDQRAQAITTFLTRLRTKDPKTESDIVTVMGLTPPWSSQNTDADARYLYDLYKEEPDEALKGLIDR